MRAMVDRADDLAAPAPLAASAIPGFIDAVPLHHARLLAGIDPVALREQLAAAPLAARPLFCLDARGASASAICDAACAQLAHAVHALWPHAWGGEDFSAARRDALTLAHLPIRLAALAERIPRLSQSWARAAVLSLLRGGFPRVPAAALDVQWEQLALMLSPGGLAVAVTLDPDAAPEPFVSAVEWLAARADVAVIVLADALPAASPAWARLLYGARTVSPRSSPAAAAAALHAGTPILLAAPDVEGRPHPLSAVELCLFRHIQADAELRPLFGFNITVEDCALLQARVDLLWRAGRVAVEIDGAEHRAPARYRADRDRDHRLMCAGYRVLRLTNEEVAEDGARAVDKIREVVRLAQRGMA